MSIITTYTYHDVPRNLTFGASLLVCCSSFPNRNDAEPQLLADYLFAFLQNNAKTSLEEMSNVSMGCEDYTTTFYIVANAIYNLGNI